MVRLPLVRQTFCLRLNRRGEQQEQPANVAFALQSRGPDRTDTDNLVSSAAQLAQGLEQVGGLLA